MPGNESHDYQGALKSASNFTQTIVWMPVCESWFVLNQGVDIKKQ